MAYALLKFINDCLNRPKDNYNQFTREFDAGYRKALQDMKEIIEVLE